MNLLSRLKLPTKLVSLLGVSALALVIEVPADSGPGGDDAAGCLMTVWLRLCGLKKAGTSH
jgi:hypothetical protein